MRNSVSGWLNCCPSAFEWTTIHSNFSWPLPVPAQEEARAVSNLELLGDAKAFDPPNPAVRSGGDHEPSPFTCGHLQVGEQILKLHRTRHSAGLKAIPASPVPQDNSPTNPIGIEELPSVPKTRPSITPWQETDLPVQAAKFSTD